jgi:hypothetical protein
MLYAWVGDQQCAPFAKGERATFSESLFAAVTSVERRTGRGR